MNDGDPEDFDSGDASNPDGLATPSGPTLAHSFNPVRGGTFLGMTGGTLLAGGAILFVIGLLIFLAGASYMMSGPVMPAPTGNFQQDQQASAAWFQESQAHGTTAFMIIVVGMVFFALGGAMLRFGLIRPVAGFVAEEASPAIETAAEAFGRGIRDVGLGATAPTPPQPEVVKIKCRNCGYLDSEDATYCSKCGKPL